MFLKKLIRQHKSVVIAPLGEQTIPEAHANPFSNKIISSAVLPPRICTAVKDLRHNQGVLSDRKKRTKVNVLGPETARWGGVLPCEGMGSKSLFPPSTIEAQAKRTCPRIFREFCRDIPDPWSKKLKTAVGVSEEKIQEHSPEPFTIPQMLKPSQD